MGVASGAGAACHSAAPELDMVFMGLSGFLCCVLCIDVCLLFPSVGHDLVCPFLSTTLVSSNFYIKNDL